MEPKTEPATPVDSRRLAALLNVEEMGEHMWRDDELAAVYRHQLAAPIRFDLAALDRRLARQVDLAASASGLLLKSFSDLLQHPHPPVEMLIMVKDFAKRSRRCPSGVLPKDIAAVLYYQCIACALLRCERRITKLSDQDLRHGVSWCLERTWLDEPTEALLRACKDRLPAEEEGP